MFRHKEDRLRAEIEAHIESEIELNVARGMTPEAARDAALQRFGNVTLSMEDSRAVWVPRLVDQAIQDVSFAVRTFRRNPVFSLATVLVIAAGIGASTAVFSFLDSVFVRPLPYFQGERLVTIGIAAPILDFDFLFANDYLYLRQTQTAFDQVTSWTGVPECDVTEERPQTWACGQVESTFLPALGVRPLVGRNFSPEEDQPNAPKVALLSYGSWQSRYGGDPLVLGRTISIDGSPVRIVGVLPRDFEFPSLAHIDLLVPQAVAFAPNRTGRALHVIGRMKEAMTPMDAFQQIQPFFRAQLEHVPPNFRREVRPVVRSVRDYQVGTLAKAGKLLAAATCAILLIVVANVAGLLLARGLSRAREFAIRSSLGAGRGRIARQLLTESLLISSGGGLLGCCLAAGLMRLFRALAPATIPHIEGMRLSGSVLLFALAASIATGVLFGFAGMLSLLRPKRSRDFVRPVLVAGQIAVSLMLLCGSGLLIESLYRIQHAAFGLESEHVLVADLSLAFKRYPNTAARQQFIDALLDRLRAIPGTSAIAFTDTVPPAGFVHDRPFSNFVLNGRPVQVEGTGGMVAWRSVTPDYFKVLGMHTEDGRTFAEADLSSKDNLIVISHALAHRLFGGNDPLGSMLKISPDSPVFRIAGVVSDVRNSGLTAHQYPEYYVVRKRVTDPRAGADADIMSRSVHFYDGQGSVLLRTAGKPEVVAAAISDQLHHLDPTTAITVNTMDNRLGALQEGPRFNAALLGGFAVLGVLLSAAGLYGLVSYMVVQRRKEIGVRFALGATRTQVIELVLHHAMQWAIPGVVVGVLLMFAVTRWFEGLLFEVQPQNPALFAGAAGLLLVVVMGASLFPGWRAAQVDPAAVLRQE